MLASAARLTLELQAEAWAQGWTLKDASAHNVLFDGCRPVFCDLLSLRRRGPADAAGWVAYGQFVRHFVLPLLAQRAWGSTPREIFLGQRDGLRAVDVARHLRGWRYWRLDVWLHVRWPARLEARRAGGQEKAVVRARASQADPLPWLLRSLRGLVDWLDRPPSSGGAWGKYTGNRQHYADTDLERKRKEVRRWLASCRPDTLLDLGANSGEFSQLAAAEGAHVLALDDDVSALDQLFRTQGGSSLVQPLRANFAHPTPATGWRLAETAALPERLRRPGFDGVLALAVIHHLLVTERLPLQQLLEELAACCRGELLLEFVGKDDPRFLEIAAGHGQLYADWSVDMLLAAAAPWFQLVERTPLTAQRELLRLRRLR